MVYSVNRGVETLGANGSITGGGNSFTFDQCNSDSHSISVTTSGNIVVDNGYDYYSLGMQGTETLGAGGVVTGGSDSFTWVQWASDSLGLAEAQGSGTSLLGSYTNYQIALTDTISNSFSDAGTDILGTSDSILGGSDTYSWVQARSLSSSEVDSGNSGTPFYVSGYGTDSSSLSDQGSSTLTTNGHIHSTDSYSFTEDSSDYVADSLSVGNTTNGSVSTGQACDTYCDTVTGAMTVSDSTTTSLDTFALVNTHSIGWALSSGNTGPTSTVDWEDDGYVSTSMTANGTKSTSNDSYSFSDTETSNDTIVVYKNLLNQFNGTATANTGSTVNKTGTTSGGSYSFTLSDTSHSQEFDNGANDYNNTWSNFSESQYFGTLDQYLITGPAIWTQTLTTSQTSTLTGGDPQGVNFTETNCLGWGLSAAEHVAEQIGAYPADLAVHDAVTPQNLTTTDGLLYGLGGQNAHPLQFAGPEIEPTPTTTGATFWLEESSESGSTNQPSNWVSHPSGIGYRRVAAPNGGSSGSSSGSSSQSSPATPPLMDSGTANGSNSDEAARLANFDAGGNENPTGPQPAPTPRAQQVAGGGGAMGADISGLGGDPILGPVFNEPPGGPIWTPYRNPLYGGGNEALTSSPGSDASRFRPGQPGTGIGVPGYGLGPRRYPGDPDAGPLKDPAPGAQIQPPATVDPPPATPPQPETPGAPPPRTEPPGGYENPAQAAVQGAGSGLAQTASAIGDAIASVPGFLFGCWDAFQAGYAEDAGKVGALVGMLQNQNPEADAKLAAIRKDRLVRQMADPNGNMSPEDYQKGVRQNFGTDLNEIGSGVKTVGEGIEGGVNLADKTGGVLALESWCSGQLGGPLPQLIRFRAYLGSAVR